jgi:hypothetical protein
LNVENIINVAVSPGIKLTSGTINPYLPSPVLNAWGTLDLKVELGWTYSYTLTGYTFLGFQVWRNLGEPGNTDQLIENQIIPEYYNNTWYYDDPYQYVQNAKPRYYVRAVYENSTDQTLVYSPISNIFDFAASPLPIELLFFRGIPGNNEVTLLWATASEINNDFFTIEHSTDANNWSIVAIVNGAGNSNRVLKYSTTISNLHEGVSYYRLKQTDFDGGFEYFNPIAIHMNKSNGLKAEIIRTFISTGQLDIWVQNPTMEAYLQVVDLQGRMVRSFGVYPEEGVQNVTLSIPHSYRNQVLVVRLVAGNEADVKKISVR